MTESEVEAGGAERARLVEALARTVRSRVGAAEGEDGSARQMSAVAAALDFMTGREAESVAVRVHPDGAVMLDGSHSFGAVVEVACRDRQFIVSSLNEELYRLGFRVLRMLHPTVGVTRGDDGAIASIGPARDAADREAFVQVELDVAVPERVVARVEAAVSAVLEDVVAATDDVEGIRAAVGDVGRALSDGDAGAHEIAALLRWFLDDHLVLLGCCCFVSEPAAAEVPPAGPGEPSDDDVPSVPVWVEEGLGLLRQPGAPLRQPVPVPSASEPLEVARTLEVSRVHRRMPIHRIDVRLPSGADGTESVFRLVGVVTRRAESVPPSDIPVLRRKLDLILGLEDVVAGSYDEQTLVSLFQVLPRDELFQQDVDTLRSTLSELVAAERHETVRVRLRPDEASRTVSVILAVPHEVYSRSLRRRIESHLLAQLDGASCDVEVSLGSRSEAVVRFLVHVRDGAPVPEGPLEDVAYEVRQLCRSWEDRLRSALSGLVGRSEAGRLVRAFASRLPSAYRSTTPAEVAAADILALRRLETSDGGVDVRFERPSGPASPDDDVDLVCRVCSVGAALELSRFLPMVESLGAWVVDAVGWSLDGGDRHVNELRMRPAGDPDGVAGGEGRGSGWGPADRMAEAVVALWEGRADVDPLNRLVVAAGLDIDDVDLLRAYRRYRRQVTHRYSSERVNEVMVGHPELAAALVGWFRARFDRRSGADADEAGARVSTLLDGVRRLDDDRILRGLAGTVAATVATNRFDRPAGPLALELDSARVPDLAEPVPHREVFVCSTAMEGVHLRFGPVSRGGIRASDRPDDYRAEVLDLARTQVLKNAVIVPTGAKGGFVVRSATPGERSGQPSVAEAYDRFITGLLDVTDADADGEDPYVVVAADKGTAGFSDRANELAAERGHWLGDAFASGGSHGFDHKALGVTARGAWVAVRHHFADLGVDVQREPVTVAGIGDMSGDVFGSAMLRSDAIRLVAAFDHRDIFIDPDPDPAAGFAERARVAGLGRSSWQDYDRAALSPGGGVWSRSVKQIELSPEAQRALKVDDAVLSPPEVVRAILRAPVDLLFAGGIGTFVRASSQDDSSIDDRANSEVRVEASTLRARVVGEGANLAFTQPARVEYARHGGRIDLDAVDNSAGVDTSDHEVNLKILLAPAVRSGAMEAERRNVLLAEARGDVVGAVLADVALQVRAVTLGQVTSAEHPQAFESLVRTLTAASILDPDVDHLPTAEDLQARQAAGGGLTRPELGVVMAGAKWWARAEAMGSALPDEPALGRVAAAYFPAWSAEECADLIAGHRLRRQLVVTGVVNEVVARAGISAVHDLVRATGVPPWQAVRALWLACRVAGYPVRSRLDDGPGGRDAEAAEDSSTERPTTTPDLAFPPPPPAALAMEAELLGALARSYLVHPPSKGLEELIERDAAVFAVLAERAASSAPTALQRSRAEALSDAGVASDQAARLATRAGLEVAPAVAQLSVATGVGPVPIAEAFDRLARRLGVDHIERAATAAEWSGSWAEASRRALLDSLVEVLRSSVAAALDGGDGGAPEELVERWCEQRADALDAVVRLRRRILSERPVDPGGLNLVVQRLRQAVT